MNANADESADQRSDRDTDRPNPLYQPDTQGYIDAGFGDRANRGKMLFSRCHHHQDVRKDKLANDISYHQNLQIKSTLCSVPLTNP